MKIQEVRSYSKLWYNSDKEKISIIEFLKKNITYDIIHQLLYELSKDTRPRTVIVNDYTQYIENENQINEKEFIERTVEVYNARLEDAQVGDEVFVSSIYGDAAETMKHLMINLNYTYPEDHYIKTNHGIFYCFEESKVWKRID